MATERDGWESFLPMLRRLIVAAIVVDIVAILVLVWQGFWWQPAIITGAAVWKTVTYRTLT